MISQLWKENHDFINWLLNLNPILNLIHKINIGHTIYSSYIGSLFIYLIWNDHRVLQYTYPEILWSLVKHKSEFQYKWMHLPWNVFVKQSVIIGTFWLFVQYSESSMFVSTDIFFACKPLLFFLFVRKNFNCKKTLLFFF